MIVTTFASHIERVQAIADIAKKSHREIYFLGRSMERFCGIAQKQGILKLPKMQVFMEAQKQLIKL